MSILTVHYGVLKATDSLFTSHAIYLSQLTLPTPGSRGWVGLVIWSSSTYKNLSWHNTKYKYTKNVIHILIYIQKNTYYILRTHELFLMPGGPASDRLSPPG